MKPVRMFRAAIACLVLLALLLPGCGTSQPASATASPYTSQPTAAIQTISATPSSRAEPSQPAESSQPTDTAQPAETASHPAAAPKYVFLFIGDGMSSAQAEAARLFSDTPLSFLEFPVKGTATTHDARNNITDSAAAGTALACGQKTRNGMLGLAADGKTKLESIACRFQDAGWKVGVVTSVTLNHATPAAFYAHASSRSGYYSIALQMADSGFDYFGGGALLEPRDKSGKKRSAYDVLADKGYRIADTKDEILALDASSGKVYAKSPILQDSGSLPYTLDAGESELALCDFVAKGIDVIDNGKGFFMMCESGKIDWACHVNDAAAAVGEVLALERAVQAALEFAKAHPGEVLVLVTADHETGGMSVGAASGGKPAYDALERQTLSRVVFFERFKKLKADHPRLKLADVLPLIRESFGLAAPGAGDASLTEMTQDEYERLKTAFAESMKPANKRKDTAETRRLYGSYDPMTQTLLHFVSAHAGIGWKSYSHTGAPAPVYAWGAGAEAFAGSYDNTDINKRLITVCIG